MSVAWLVIFVLLWTGFLAGVARLVTSGRVNARFAQLVWRGAAILAVLPLIIIPVASLLPEDLPGAIPDLPYVEPATGAMTTASASLQTAISGPEWAWTAPALLIVLLAGWAYRLGTTLLGQLRLQALKSRSRPYNGISDPIPLTLMGLERVPDIRIIDAGSPFVAGLARRAIYVPQGLDTPGDLRQIMIHECVHLKRGDLVTRPVERLVADLFWFSPFAWMMRRELDFWREAVCDELASSISGDRIGYARTLASAARISKLRALPVAAFILPKKSSLPKRLARLLETHPTESRPIVAFCATLTALALTPFALAEVKQDGEAAAPRSALVFEHAVLISPVAKITSRFGNRKDPLNSKAAFHNGTDIGAPMGTPVYTPTCGQVVYSGFKEGYGETVEIAFADGSKMRFAQLSKRLVRAGDDIAVGTMIGKVGMSGRASGPHLHLEHWRPEVDAATGEVTIKPLDPTKSAGLVLYSAG